ncbi:MAG: TetR/AcrR family transcriptional repressor of nem operon [Oleiphilaceae bacterium]|jgi:TetR/AcrR family transcriptional repressor of nem operon
MKILNDTRTAILDVAQDMVQRQSISGVSFQELANRVGIKKGSVYYHFESKDNLAVALLERATSVMKESFIRGKTKSPVERLNYFLNIYRHHIIPAEKLCPGGAFAGEWGKLSSPVKAQVNRLIDAQVKGVSEILTEGIQGGEFNDHAKTVEELAQWVIACIQGALVTSRITESRVMFETTLTIITEYLRQKS